MDIKCESFFVVVVVFFSAHLNRCAAARIYTGGDWYSSGLRMRTV